MHSPPPVVDDQLVVERRADAGVVTVTVRGEIDLATAPALERAIRDAERSRATRIVLDLAALTFIDSTGIHLLLRAHQRANSDGRQFVLTRVPARAQRVFKLAGMGTRLAVA